jgi:hypothetical protein
MLENKDQAGKNKSCEQGDVVFVAVGSKDDFPDPELFNSIMEHAIPAEEYADDWDDSDSSDDDEHATVSETLPEMAIILRKRIHHVGRPRE